MTHPPRNDWVDLLRASGAVAVTLFHLNVIIPDSTTYGLGRLWHQFWLHGHLGVPMFFALSGYFLVPSWRKAGQIGHFLKRRLLRLLGPYWLSLLLVGLVATTFKLLHGINDVAVLPRTLPDVLATLTLLTDPFTSVPRINWVYWTLTPLLCYTGLAGLLLLLRRPAQLVALAGLHFAFCTLDLLLNPGETGWLALLKYWPMFGAGLALALWPQRTASCNWILGTSLLHGACSLVLGLDELGYIACALLTVGAIAILPSSPLPSWLRPAAALGRISYSLYLIHIPVGVFILFRWFPSSPTGSLQFIGAQLLLLSGIIAASVIYYRWCEHPFQGRGA